MLQTNELLDCLRTAGKTYHEQGPDSFIKYLTDLGVAQDIAQSFIGTLQKTAPLTISDKSILTMDHGAAIEALGLQQSGEFGPKNLLAYRLLEVLIPGYKCIVSGTTHRGGVVGNKHKDTLRVNFEGIDAENGKCYLSFMDILQGARPKHKKASFLFEQMGAVSVGDILSIKGIHATPHIGDWEHGVHRIAPLVLGVPMCLDELRNDGAHKTSHVGRFDGQILSDQVGVWGPYMDWANDASSVYKAETSSPFAFHVHQMGKQQGDIRLSLARIVEFFGTSTLEKFLQNLVSEVPSAFNRLFNAGGGVHRSTAVRKEVIEFGAVSFPKREIVSNVMGTLAYFAAVEKDPHVEIERIPRIIFDTATCIVLDSIMMGHKGDAHCLSGSGMDSYLFQDSFRANGLKRRSDRVYRIMQAVMSDLPEVMTLKVYSLEESLLMNGSQYDRTLCERAKSQLLDGRESKEDLPSVMNPHLLPGVMGE